MNASTQARPATGSRPYARIIRRFVRMGARDEAARLLDRMHPAEAVEILKSLPPAERKAFTEILLAHERAGEVLAVLPEGQVGDLLSQVSDQRVAALLSRLPPDDAADLLGLLPEERADVVLKLFDDKTAATLDRLMTYGRETAGGMMTTRFVALDRHTLVSEAIARIRSEPEAEMVFYLYVTDEFGHLEGVVSLRQLVLARPDQELLSIMNPKVIRVRTDEPRSGVADLIARYNLLAIPVVDASQALAGIITVDDAIDAITDETTREMYRLAGLDTQDRVSSPPLDSVRRRLPWMVINLGTAILASWVVWLFEGSIAQVVTLATFMPIVAGMGGNGATQTLTVIIRGLALGELAPGTARRAILKEASVGIVIGASTGLLMALVATLWKGKPILGLVIALAMITNMCVAGLAGALVPLVLKRLGLDPAVSSSVIVTTFTDCCGFLAFLGLATLLMRFLV